MSLNPLTWFKSENVPTPLTEAQMEDQVLGEVVGEALSNKEAVLLTQMLGYTDQDMASKELKAEIKKLAKAAPGADTDDDGFLAYWDKKGFIEDTDKNKEFNRKYRYGQYQFMIQNSTEISTAVKTYIAEILSAIREEDDFFTVTVYDEKSVAMPKETNFTKKALTALGLTGDTRLATSNLVLNGDQFFRILDIRQVKSKDKEKVSKVVDGWFFDGYAIEHPLLVSRTNIPGRDIPMKFMEKRILSSKGGKGQGRAVAPWDMIHARNYTVRDDIRPYGESLIETVRSVFKRLLILEALLALTRSSKVERLVVGIPTNVDNPDTMITKLVRYRQLVKSIILGGGVNPTSEKKNIGLTEVFYVPKGKTTETSFDVQRLASSIDISSIEDVEYNQDKVINGLSLPRGYLKSDDAYAGYRKLALQDLRLSRTIQIVFHAMAEAITLAAKIVLFRTEKWKSGMKVVTTFTPPAPIASEQLAGFREALDVIDQIILITGTPDPETGEVPKDPVMLRSLLIRLAKLPESVVNSIIPEKREECAKLTTEDIKKRAVMAFTSLGVEHVTSDEVYFVDAPRVLSARVALENVI